MYYCRNCGSEVNADDKFCKSCGGKQLVNEVVNNMADSKFNSKGIPFKLKDNKKKALIIMATVIITLVIIFVFSRTIVDSLKGYKETTSIEKIYPNGGEIFLQVDSLNILEKDFRQTIKILKNRIENAGVKKFQISRLDYSNIKIDFLDITVKDVIIAAIDIPEIKFVGPDNTIILTNKDVYESTTGVDPSNDQPVVQLKLTKEGRKKFKEATEKYIGQIITIYMGEDVISAPTVQSVIPDGSAIIAGSKDIEEAKRLSRLINEGAGMLKLKILKAD